MDTVQMEKQLEEWMTGQADCLGLNRKTIKASYIWNPGGFVNLSFLVSDGSTHLHVKLADQIHSPQLKQWSRLYTYLESNYFAPRLIKIIDEEIIPGRPTGLIFSHFAGVSLEASAHQERCLEKVLQVVSKLHRDSKLQFRLERAGDASHWLNQVNSIVGEEDARRLPVYFRAALLDEVIDVLADYIDAEQYPTVKAQAQERARRTHLEALSCYMDRYAALDSD
jgi:hypothetical protein